MGESTSEAVAKVEETRARLDAEVAELQRRVPPMMERAKRTAATAAGVAVGGILVLVSLRLGIRRRRARKAAAAVPAPVRVLREAREQLTDRLAS